MTEAKSDAISSSVPHFPGITRLCFSPDGGYVLLFLSCWPCRDWTARLTPQYYLHGWCGLPRTSVQGRRPRRRAWIRRQPYGGCSVTRKLGELLAPQDWKTGLMSRKHISSQHLSMLSLGNSLVQETSLRGISPGHPVCRCDGSA